MLRFQTLDGWRGIAAAFVALYHLNFLNHIHDWGFLRNSYLFVDFFFVLSGFVITHAYINKIQNSTDLKRFINRRLSRLLPLHLFILALFIILEFSKLLLVQSGAWQLDTQPFTGEYSIQSLISNIFLAHSLGIHDHLSWNYPSWSISVEFYTYLIFSIVSLIGFKFRTLFPFLYLGLILVSFYYIYDNTSNLNDATYHYGIFRCIVGFFLGGICYRLFLKTRALVFPFATILEVSLMVTIYLFVTFYGHEKLSVIAPFIFTITVYIFSFEQGKISSLLKAKVVQNLGKWSYSIYMIHALLILIIGRSLNLFEKMTGETYFIKHVYENSETELVLLHNPYFMDFLTVVFLAVVIALSSLTYKYIELRASNFSFFKNKAST